MTRSALSGFVWLLVGGACAAPDSKAALKLECDNPTTLRFVPDTGSADEAYLCFGFDVGLLENGTISAVLWHTPSVTSAFQIHHATLFAVPADYPDGPLTCDGMPPGAVPLHVTSLGGTDLILPAGVALRLPVDTKRFVVQAHTRRVGSGPVEDAQVTLCAGDSAPAHLAVLMGYQSPVPAIRPRHVETSAGGCTLGGNVHLWSVWPHMHLLGREISVDLQRSGGGSTRLVDVNPWDFQAQKTYALAVDARIGDQLISHCTWQNDTDQYAFPGPLTENEMCDTFFIAWPAEAAICR